jgi:hypothetical protein
MPAKVNTINSDKIVNFGQLEIGAAFFGQDDQLWHKINNNTAITYEETCSDDSVPCSCTFPKVYVVYPVRIHVIEVEKV